jgi:hypothetical protein
VKTVIALIIGLLLLVAFGAEARPRSPSVPADYVLALQTANVFLSAWAHRDAEAGVKLISRRLLSELERHNNMEWFRDYIKPRCQVYTIDRFPRL